MSEPSLFFKLTLDNRIDLYKSGDVAVVATLFTMSALDSKEDKVAQVRSLTDSFVTNTGHITISDAELETRLTREYLQELCILGEIDAVEYRGVWLIDRLSLANHMFKKTRDFALNPKPVRQIEPATLSQPSGHLSASLYIKPQTEAHLKQSIMINSPLSDSSISNAVLDIIDVLEKRTPGTYIDDSAIARELGLEIQDIRDRIEILESEGRVKTANTLGGYNVILTARGRLALRYPGANLSAIVRDHDSSSYIAQTNPSLSVLFLAADPSNLSRLQISLEFREIHESLKMALRRNHFRLELPQLAVRAKDISQALLDTLPQIVHFSGHGTQDGALCFENHIGEASPVSPDALAALFQHFKNTVNCVILNACFVEAQASAIAKHIEFVIGMNQPISDKAAIAFTIGFYQALGAGRNIEDAFELGCVQIKLQGFAEDSAPILMRRLDNLV